MAPVNRRHHLVKAADAVKRLVKSITQSSPGAPEAPFTPPSTSEQFIHQQRGGCMNGGTFEASPLGRLPAQTEEASATFSVLPPWM